VEDATVMVEAADPPRETEAGVVAEAVRLNADWVMVTLPDWDAAR
jgi:hypothetical protein